MHLVIAPPSAGIARQRIALAAEWSAWAGQALTWATVTGWVPDATDPGLVSANQLRIVGDSPAMTLDWYVTGKAPIGGTFEVRMLRNGVQAGAIVSVGAGQKSVQWTGAVADGDLIRLEARGGNTGGAAYGHTITTGSITVS